MSYQTMLPVLVALAMTGCGSDAPGPNESASEAAAVSAQDVGPVTTNSGDALVISARTYSSGSVKARVTGFFSLEGTQELNLPASLTDDDQTWLQYGVSGAPDLNVLFTNSQSLAEHGVTVAVGPHTVTTTSTSGECRTKVDVTPALVSGRYSCTGSMGYNNQTGQMGEVDVEVVFDAGS